MSTIGIELLIDGEPFPVESFDVHGSSSGHTGSLSASTGMDRLADAGMDLAAMAAQAPTALTVDVFVTIDGEREQIFGGEYLGAKFRYSATEVTIRARDWSGPLVDQRRVLVSILGGNTGALAPSEKATAGVNTQNQKLSQIVAAIAEQFSLSPVLRLATNGDPDIGTIFGDTGNAILTTTPQSLWAILNRLARDTGNIVYVTPQKELVFGEPGADLDTIPISWMVNPVPPGVSAAVTLDIDHNPRRNMTFQVVVLSYDPTRSELTKGQAYVIGSNFTTNDNANVRAGMWSGQQAQQILNATTKKGGKPSKDKNNQVPVYTFHVDGLTAAQAQQRAQAIAMDISKHELIGDVRLNFLGRVLPSNPVKLLGQIAPDFASHTYYVTEYHHHYRISSGHGGGSDLGTDLKLLDRQPVGAGEPITKAAK